MLHLSAHVTHYWWIDSRESLPGSSARCGKREMWDIEILVHVCLETHPDPYVLEVLSKYHGKS